MAGILASSASKVMASGDTAASNVMSGYVAGEQIVLSALPTGTVYAWALAIPSGSAVARSGLSSTILPSPVFTPDVAGEYVVTCTVDGATAYVLRCSVVAAAATVATGAIRFLPQTNASVPAPSTGATLFYSSDDDAMTLKFPDNSVEQVTST